DCSTCVTHDPHSLPTRRSSDLRSDLMISTDCRPGSLRVARIRSLWNFTSSSSSGLTWNSSSNSRSDLLTRALRRSCALLPGVSRSEEHTSELQSRFDLVCRLLL